MNKKGPFSGLFYFHLNNEEFELSKHHAVLSKAVCVTNSPYGSNQLQFGGKHTCRP